MGGSVKKREDLDADSAAVVSGMKHKNQLLLLFV